MWKELIEVGKKEGVNIIYIAESPKESTDSPDAKSSTSAVKKEQQIRAASIHICIERVTSDGDSGNFLISKITF